jgi:ribosome biogenesis GTPase
LLEGKIIKGIGGFYYVKTNEGIYSCRARGKFRNKSLTPMVGDIVNIDVTDTEKFEGYVTEILPRKNELFRPLVSNIDLLLVTFAVTSPEPSFVLIDKLIVTAEARKIPVAICINKCDLDEEKAEEYAHTYELSRYPVVVCSAESGKNVDALRELLRDKTTALAGNSGVGKSSLLNAIGESFNLKTGSVSDKIQRGKHTTRHTELFPLSFGGYVLDTPGFGSYELERLSFRELPSLFPEIARHEGGCRFSGCSHIKEPDCSVKDALSEGKISKTRYNSYTELYEQLKQIKEWE